MNNRGCSKTSVFGTATLDLLEKAGFRPLFQKLVPKPTGFWNKLNRIRLNFFKYCFVSLLLLYGINNAPADEKIGKIVDIIIRLPETNWEMTSILINTTDKNTDIADTIININSASLYPAFRNIARDFKTGDEILFDDDGIFYSDVFNMHEVLFRNILAKNNISILHYFPEYYEFEFPFAVERDRLQKN